MNGFVILGYYGRGNLGDETNLRELVALIRSEQPDAEITVISAAPEETALAYQVESIGKYSFIDIFLAIREADVLIGGGGSLFQDRTSLRSLIYYCALVLMAKLSKVRILMYGQGIGPLRSRIGRILAGWVLSMADLITVRDRLSIISLSELNVRQPEIFITAEPLLAVNQLPEAAVVDYWRAYQTEKRFKLGLFIQAYGFLKKKFWTQFIDCLNWDQNIELFLIAVDDRDQPLLKELAVSSDLTILPVSGWSDLQKAVGGLDLVASTRLHGLVAAVVQNIPCFGVAVDPKIEGFCLQLSLPFYRPTAKSEWLTLGNRIINFLYQPLAERKSWEQQLPFWKARALENQLILKKFIADL